MHFVYILESENQEHWYVGITNNVEKRIAEHNAGESIHTNKFKPWKLYAYFAISDLKKAESFERYLKSHSGRAFMKKHL